jgi:E3 ubiquitin-protein ligase BRE1
LKASSELTKELEDTLEKTRNNWSKAVANEKAAIATIDEMTTKFNKRWSELTGDSSLDHTSKEGNEEGMLKIKEQALEITELQHKLDQALENVRQTESTRNSLKEALLLNGSIQSKLDEIKAKYAAVQAQRNNLVAGNRASGVVNPPASTSSQNNKDKVTDQSSVSNSRDKESGTPIAPPEKDATANNNKMDKMYRKARKDLAALKESKEIVKGKLDRSEKERESLGEANARLLKQIAEKDDVNAKSLSTILYLKGQTDVLLAEKHILEQQTKTAGQLALAARLATNAKDRFADEVAKEKSHLELRIEELENVRKQSKLEHDRLVSELAELQGKVSAEDSELQNARTRINELVEESAEQRERTSDLESAFSKANREAREAKSKLQLHMDNISAANAASSTATSTSIGSMRVAAGGSEFTVEQLTTQISVLKSRLACPVCHERDKQCIIMRCRHMHCQQCVDDQISNRSRKCPTCNNKFSEKDVEDIWLNT